MAEMAGPGELQNLIEMALQNDKKYQTFLKSIEKAGGPGSNATLDRMTKARKEQVIAIVKADNPQARKRGGMIDAFKRGYRTNKL